MGAVCFHESKVYFHISLNRSEHFLDFIFDGVVQDAVVEALNLMPALAHEELAEVPRYASGALAFQKLEQRMCIGSVDVNHGKRFSKIDIALLHKRLDIRRLFLGHSHELIAGEEQNLEI